MDQENIAVQENLAVYEALRSTILHCEDGIRNARIYMYTVYFAIIAFSFDRPWMFLISLFVLIAFQAMINSDRIAVERASSYIRVFFETKRKDMHWELINKDKEHSGVYLPQYQNAGWYIDHIASTILAIISLVSLILTYSFEHGSSFPVFVSLQIMMAVVLFGLIIYVNSKMYTSIFKNKDKATIAAIDKSIEDFYQKVTASEKRQP